VRPGLPDRYEINDTFATALLHWRSNLLYRALYRWISLTNFNPSLTNEQLHKVVALQGRHTRASALKQQQQRQQRQQQQRQQQQQQQQPEQQPEQQPIKESDKTSSTTSLNATQQHQIPQTPPSSPALPPPRFAQPKSFNTPKTPLQPPSSCTTTATTTCSNGEPPSSPAPSDLNITVITPIIVRTEVVPSIHHALAH
jgi:type II secretory pathway pseudopilin PulG